MVGVFPDPFNSREFELYIDMVPARRASHAQIISEAAHWASWLDEHDLVGQEKPPRLWLDMQSTSIAVLGVILGVMGPLGYFSSTLGNIISAFGFGMTVWGFLLGAKVKEEQREISLAAWRVRDRLRDLVQRRRALKEVEDMLRKANS